MPKTTVNLVDSAYRAVMQEQDDTILWLLAAMQGAGAQQTVVLRGNAVNCAVAGQGADLVEKRGIPVYVVAEDVDARGIEERELIPGIQRLSRSELPAMGGEHAVVSLWEGP